MTTNSQEWQNARQAWLDKDLQYTKVLSTSTNFYELEKVLYIADHLDPDNIDDDNDRNYEFLQEAYSDAQLKVLEVCSEFAKKKASLDVSREEREKAKKAFYIVKTNEKEVA